MSLRPLSRLAIGLAIAAMAVGAITGCGGSSRDIRIAGAGDMYFLSLAIDTAYRAGEARTGVNMRLSRDAIDELKSGRADAVLLGREPTSAEAEGLRDYVLAYDAVCVILDANSYLGGMVYQGGTPFHKSSGLRALSADNLTELLSSGWTMTQGLYNANAIDLGSWLWNVESAVWAGATKLVRSSFAFPVGEFDSQTVLFRSLGLDEDKLLAGTTSFTCQQYKIEEEVLSYEYTGSVYGQTSGIQDFAFKLGFASRRAMTVAPEHVPVKVIAIDGIDPLVNPNAVYDGTYKLSRRVHLLVSEHAAPAVTRLAEFLVSEPGQKLIAGAGYLPVRHG